MLLAAFVAVALIAQPAGAITNGVEDTENRYPFVGLTVLRVGDDVGVQCSGVLIAPTVFVTAGHCTYNAIHRWHATNVWITFEQDVAEPPLTSGPLVIDVTQGGPLGEHLFWYPGYQPPPAAYGGTPKHDVGVIVLPHTAPAGGPFPELVTVGALAELEDPQHQVFTSVGYGCESGWPAPSVPRPWEQNVCDNDRTIGTHAFNALTPTWLKLSENYPSTGSSGAGAHDSGAPVFDAGGVLVGSLYDGGDAAGVAQVNMMRFDEPTNHAFITSFVGT